VVSALLPLHDLYLMKLDEKRRNVPKRAALWIVCLIHAFIMVGLLQRPQIAMS